MADASRWQHVKGLFQAALERPAEARRAFLERACPDAEFLQDFAKQAVQRVSAKILQATGKSPEQPAAKP